MKRLTLLTILLVVVGLTAGFAVDVKPSVAIGGTGTLQFGIGLDEFDTGFYNSFTVNFDVTFIASASDTHEGKDTVFGGITLGSFAFTGDNVTPTITLPTVTAWLMAGPAKIGIYDAPDFAIDKVTAIEAAVENVREDESGGDVANDYAGYGTYVMYPLGPISLTARVLSDSDWHDVPADNDYAVGLGAAGTVGPATLGFDAFYALDTSVAGFGVSASAAFGPVGVSAGFDGQYAAAFAWEVGAGVSATIMEGVTAGVNVVYGNAFDLDVKIALAEAEAKGLVDNLAFGVTAYLLDILSGALEYEATVTGSYKINNITPSFSVTYGDPSEVGQDSILKATVTVTVNPIFPLTSFTLTYTSGNFLAATPVLGDIVAGLTVTY